MSSSHKNHTHDKLSFWAGYFRRNAHKTLNLFNKSPDASTCHFFSIFKFYIFFISVNFLSGLILLILTTIPPSIGDVSHLAFNGVNNQYFNDIRYAMAPQKFHENVLISRWSHIFFSLIKSLVRTQSPEECHPGRAECGLSNLQSATGYEF